MIKRPLLVAGAGFSMLLYVLFAAGFPFAGSTAKQKVFQTYINENRPVNLTGQIYQRLEKENTCQYRIKDIILEDSTRQPSHLLKQQTNLLVITEKSFYGTIGSRIRVKGSLNVMETPVNPGQFDAAAYYAAQKIFYSVWAEQAEIIEQKNGWQEYLQCLRKQMEENMQEMLPDPSNSVLSAMLLGDKSDLDAETKYNYEVGGLLHILSISGLHLSLLGMGLYRLLCRIRAPKIPAAVIAAIVMSVYCWFTGNQPSTLRALVMFFLLLGAKITGRSYDCLSAAGLAFLLMLVENPYYLFYSGFWLSFVAVLGAGVIYPIWSDGIFEKYKVRSAWQKRKQAWKNRICACAVITLGTLPLTCYYFYEIPLLGLIPNLLILPTVGFLLFCGVLGSTAGLIHIAAGRIVLLPVTFLLFGYEKLLELLRMIPGAVFICGQPAWWQMLVYYVMFAAATWHLQSDHKRKKVTVLVIMAAAIVCLFWREPVKLSIAALDVGQGDAIVVRTECLTYLVDGGSNSEKEVGNYRILPYLKSQGIRSLEGIVVTHPDNDHISGILEILEKAAKNQTALEIKNLFLPIWMKETAEEQRFLELCRAAEITVHYLQKGDRIQQGALRIEVLHPGTGDYSDDPNSGSVTLGIHYGTFDALLTGDLESEAEQEVIEEIRRSKEPKYEYLKVAHHGSKTSTTEELLSLIHPELSVISCGENNTYGHPHTETLQRLKDAESTVMATKEYGAITVEVGEKVEVYTFLQVVHAKAII